MFSPCVLSSYEAALSSSCSGSSFETFGTFETDVSVGRVLLLSGVVSSFETFRTFRTDVSVGMSLFSGRVGGRVVCARAL